MVRSGFKPRLKPLRSLLCAAVLAATSAGAANAQIFDADRAPTPWAARDSLGAVPVFYIADRFGRPVAADASGETELFLTRMQASLALGYYRGRPEAAQTHGSLHVAVTDLARVSGLSGKRHFVKPPTVVEAAAGMNEAPLFLVRDKAGAPYTLRGPDGRRRTYFFLSESDAIGFIEMVVHETGVTEEDVRLSLAPLSDIMAKMLAGDSPGVNNWAIWSNAEAIEDAAIVRAELSRQTAGLPTGKP